MARVDNCCIACRVNHSDIDTKKVDYVIYLFYSMYSFGIKTTRYN